MSTHIAKSSFVPQLVLKQVLGSGRKDRWEAVKKIFKETLASIYGSQDEIIKGIKKTSVFRCRLLFSGDKQVGLVAFAKTHSSEFADRGLQDCLEIKTIHSLGQEGVAPESIYGALLGEVLQTAEEIKARSLCVRVARTATDAIRFLEANKFKSIEAGSTTDIIFLGRKLEAFATSRKRAAETEAEEPAAATTTTSSADAKCRRTLASEPVAASERFAPMTSTASSVSQYAVSSSSLSYGSNGYPTQPQQQRSFSYAPRQPYQTAQSGGLMSRTSDGYSAHQQAPRSGSSSGSHYASPSTPQYPMSTFSSNAPYFSAQPQASRWHEASLKAQYIKLIQSGQKTIEGRIRNGVFTNWRQGDTVRFFSGNRDVICRITRIVSYNSFAEMLRQEGITPCLPDVGTIEDGIRIYDSIPGYADRARQHGVLAIHIEKQ